MYKNVKSRKELADLFNIDIKTLANWEKNKPDLIKVIALGLYFDRHCEDLECLITKVNEIIDSEDGHKISFTKMIKEEK